MPICKGTGEKNEYANYMDGKSHGEAEKTSKRMKKMGLD